MHIDRKRWADMRRNGRIGLIGSILIGIGGGAWLIVAAFVGARQTSLVPGILLVLLGIGAGWSFRQRQRHPISDSGSPELLTLDREGLRLDPGEGADLVTRAWGAFSVSWLHRSGSYLEVVPEGLPAGRWPVIVIDVTRQALAAAITELSGGTASLGDGSRPPRPRRTDR